MWRALQRWLTPGLSELETAIVEATIAASPAAAQALLRAQLTDVNRIDREPTQTLLYPIRNGRVVREHLVPNDADEVALCKVVLQHEASSTSVTATVWLTRGSLFSIDLSRARQHGTYRVVSARLLADPCAVPIPPDRRSNVGPLPAWCRGHTFTDLRAPLTEEARRTWREALGIELPTDYDEFIASTDGARLGDRVVLGPSDVYRVRHDENEFLVVATIADVSLLALRVGGDDTLFELDLEGGAPVARGSAFAAAFLR